MDRYRINFSATTATVERLDAVGEVYDLNAEGEPCADLDDLRGFVRELRAQGAYDESIEAMLLAQCDAATGA